MVVARHIRLSGETLYRFLFKFILIFHLMILELSDLSSLGCVLLLVVWMYEGDAAHRAKWLKALVSLVSRPADPDPGVSG